jgi:hypothetical protein
MDLGAITSFLATLQMDWVILGAFALLAALDTIRSGAHRVVLFALALPGALLVFTSIPSTAFLAGIAEQLGTPIMQAGLFLGLVALFFILIGRIGLSRGGGAGQSIQAALAGVAGAALLATFWLQVPALDSLWHFGPGVVTIFGEGYRAIWLVGSYAILAYVHRS